MNNLTMLSFNEWLDLDRVNNPENSEYNNFIFIKINKGLNKHDFDEHESDCSDDGDESFDEHLIKHHFLVARILKYAWKRKLKLIDCSYNKLTFKSKSDYGFKMTDFPNLSNKPKWFCNICDDGIDYTTKYDHIESDYHLERCKTLHSIFTKLKNDCESGNNM